MVSYRSAPLEKGGDQTAAILCSSGTTGLPKGVTLSHKAIVYGAFMTLFQEDTVFCYSSLYWLSGFLTLTQSTFIGATRVITNKSFTPELTFATIERYNVSILFTPPSQMALMVQHPNLAAANLSSLQRYVCGGSAVPYPVVEKIREAIPSCIVLIGYGMTEAGGACILGPPKAPNSMQFIKKGFLIRIVGERDENLGPKETGEIAVKPPYAWNGYFGNRKASDEICRNGWVFSGDLGYFDEEGSLFIVDRKKDILKFKNFHYFPTEIENTIMELPDVVEVCVCGVPDLVMTDLPAAAIIKKDDSLLNEEQVYRQVQEKLDDFKQLRGGVYFLEKFPKTASGKNIRNKVKEIVVKLHEQKHTI